jgi:N,N'-diacetyllegionaminate synthase
MKKVEIIAEAGVNHNGKLILAKKLALYAKKAGADFIKFQIYNADEIATSNLKKAPYQKKSSVNKNENQKEMLKNLSLTHQNFDKLIAYCKKIRIKFLASVFDLNSLKYLQKKTNVIKIGSSEITNFILLKHVALLNKKLIISTGMCGIKDIREAIAFLKKNGQKNKIILLHCNTAYPTPYEDVNLLTIRKLKSSFNIDIGYSDHALGNEVSFAAIALGSVIIEKHFTLNKKLKGPDHSISCDFKELKLLVEGAKKIFKTLKIKSGSLTNSEKKNYSLVKKYLVASKFIDKDEKFTLKNITSKRTGGGIEAKRFEKIINKRAKKKFKIDQIITINEK